MAIDFKTILLVILIIGVIGGVVYLGIRIMNTPTTNVIEEDLAIEDRTVSTNRQNTVRNTVKNETTNTTNNAVEDANNTVLNLEENTQVSRENTFSNGDLTQLYGTGVSINNNTPKTDFPEDSYYSVAFSLPGNARANYYVPSNWTRNETKLIDPDTGANVQCIGVKTSELLEEEVYQETTYEQILEAFIENERNNATYPDEVEFSTRELVNDGGTYTVIVKRDGFIVSSYIVYVKNLYEYHLQFNTTSDDYNDATIETINNIFSSYKIF